MGWDLSKYVEVKDRLPLFWEKYPDGSVITELVSDEVIEYQNNKGETVSMAKTVFKCSLYANRNNFSDKPISVGYAMETNESSKIDKFFENTETSAIGRALSNGGFSSISEPRPSREEMESAERMSENNLSKKSGLSKFKK